MSYAYYPGCSLTGTAKDYDDSSRTVMAALDKPLEDLKDWNCCGASATSVVDPHLTVALSARNLALAEAEQKDVVTACASCYTNLRKAREVVTGKTAAGQVVREALAETGRAVTGKVRVKHLLEVVMDEVGIDGVSAKVRKPLQGLKVAAYYGCQLGRPAGGAVHPELPTELDDLLVALGAEPVAWTGKINCCGASTVVTKESTALELIDDVLTRAESAGAQIIATACPMCHMNLDVYQSRVNSAQDRSHRIPIVFFTQLMGIALGLPAKQLGLDAAFVPSGPVLAPYMVEGVAK
jgi:heterodisulfide reductase subunit B